MPLIKAQLETQIRVGLETDIEFKAALFKLAKDSMDSFQMAQKQAQMNAGTVAGFKVAQTVASIAFAKKFEQIQPIIAEFVAEHVANSVDTFVKSGQVIIPVPLSGAGGGPAPVVIPMVPPGKVI